jgi:predicted fused transcriptional regulator/phosphomethylpyrimidine kinase
MTQKFIPEMRKNFVDAGIDMKEDGDVAQIDGGFLISVKGQVFRFLKITLGIPMFVMYMLWVVVEMLPSVHWQRWVWKK